MTAIDDYRNTLAELVNEYKVESVLEIGVEKGISTEVFCRLGCEVRGLDINDTKFKHKNFTFIKTDATEYLKALHPSPTFQMIFLDAFYTGKRLARDVELCWPLLDEGGILVFNEYVDFANHRSGEIRKFVHRFANKNMMPYTVYPLRNGFAVFEK